MGSQAAPADQQNLPQTMVMGGSSGPLNITALKATAGATNVFQFSKDFNIAFGKGLCCFRHGGVYGLHPDLKAALLAVSAPMTQL